MTIFEYCLTFDKYFGTLHCNHFARSIVYEVFYPRLYHTGSEGTTNIFFEVCLICLYLFGKPETFEYIFVRFEADGTQQRRYGQFLFSVDISVHDIVYIGGKLYPRATERDNPCRIEHGIVSVYRRAEEYTRRAVKLRNNHAFCSVYHKSSFVGHIRNGTQIDILHYGSKIFVVGVVALQTKLSFQRYAVCQSASDTLFDGISRRVDEIVYKVECKVVSCIGYGEVLGENLVHPFVFSFFCLGIELEEVSK